jgi:hypothetical protein
MSSYDFNKDGYYEECYNFNLKGDKIIRYFDVNNNGIIDSIEIQLENRSIIKLKYFDQGGYFQIKK